MKHSYDIGENLKSIMAKRKITIAQLAEASDLSEDTIKAIRSGKTKNPTIQVIVAIADALNCTIDGLLKRQSLPPEETELLKNYRTMNQHGKNNIHLLMETEHHLQTTITENTRQIPCIIPALAKSADVDFSMHNLEMISLPADYYEEADFAVKLISNMLFPIFSKGDLLAVEKKFPSIGSIAVFIDSQGTEMIRKYTEKDGAMFLEALTKCSKSRYYTDDIICIGTILGIIRLENKQGQDFI